MAAQQRRSPPWARALMLVAGTGGALVISGCGGGTMAPAQYPAPPTQTSSRPDIPNYHAPTEWIEMIATAGLGEYAELGRTMLAEGRVRIVAPPVLDANYNAFAWLDANEIWINEPMFARYPDVLDQATIFLHELIHVKSTEQTHFGPWWSALSEFRAYYEQRPQSAGLKPVAAHADEASVGIGNLLGNRTEAVASSGTR